MVSNLKFLSIILISCCVVSILLIGFWPNKVKTAIKSQQYSDVHIIFDLNGVLAKTSGAEKIIGKGKLVGYALANLFSIASIKEKIQDKLMDFLDSIEPRNPREINAEDDKGNPLPQILCDLMKGTRSSAELLQLVEAKAEELPHTRESSIITSIARMMFTPEKALCIQTWVPEALEFVQQLKERGCKVYILSNLGSEIYEAMKQTEPHASTLALFDGVYISGDHGKLKPDPAIFKDFLKAFDINPAQAFFIDDQECNVVKAKQCGIKSHVCPTYKGSPDIEQTEEAVLAWLAQQNPKSSKETPGACDKHLARSIETE